MAKSLPLISALVCLAAVCAQDPLTRVPVPRFHLTARPWSEIDYSRQQILERVEGVCRAAAQFQDDAGAIIDPYLDREHQYSTPYFAFAASVLIDAGRAADLLPVGIAAMEKSTADFAGGAQAIPDAHGEFFIAPLTQACFNPARDFGPRLFAYFAGWGSVALPGPRAMAFFTVYIASPIVGAIAGVGFFQGVLKRYVLCPKPEELIDA